MRGRFFPNDCKLRRKTVPDNEHVEYTKKIHSVEIHWGTKLGADLLYKMLRSLTCMM